MVLDNIHYIQVCSVLAIPEDAEDVHGAGFVVAAATAQHLAVKYHILPL